MSDDTIIISAHYFKRIQRRIEKLSDLADQMNVNAFRFKQICNSLKEDYEKTSREE